jgi:SAM-dependent methyltransferase
MEPRAKWDAASRTYDWFSFGEMRRLGPHKRRLFTKMRGAVLMVAAGTGNDFQFFPPGQDIIAVDISPKMIERAQSRARAYAGRIDLRVMDVCNLPFPEATFDTVATVCTFCSVPKPVAGLRELYRVLKPGGQLQIFEHVRSAIGPFGVFLDLVTPLFRRYGPDLNRDTMGNVLKAGFEIRREENVYLDIVKIVEARRPLRSRDIRAGETTHPAENADQDSRRAGTRVLVRPIE